MYERAHMKGASRAGAVTRGMQLGGAKFPNVGKIHPKHPRGVNGPLLPSVLDLGCGVISADLKNALLVAFGVSFGTILVSKSILGGFGGTLGAPEWPRPEKVGSLAALVPPFWILLRHFSAQDRPRSCFFHVFNAYLLIWEFNQNVNKPYLLTPAPLNSMC